MQTVRGMRVVRPERVVADDREPEPVPQGNRRLERVVVRNALIQHAPVEDVLAPGRQAGVPDDANPGRVDADLGP